MSNTTIKLKYLLCVIFTGFVTLNAIADESSTRNRIDSLEQVLKDPALEDTTRVKALNKLQIAYGHVGELDKMPAIIEEELKLAEKIDYDRGKGIAYNAKALLMGRDAETKKAIEYFEKSLKIWVKMNDRKRWANVLHNIGGEYLDLGDYSKALTYYDSSIVIHQSLGNTREIGMSLNNMGQIYKRQGKYSKAMESYTKAVHYGKEAKDDRNLILYLGNIGSIYEHQHTYEKAMDFHLQALKLAQKLGDKKHESFCYQNIAATYLGDKKYKKAEEFMLKSLELRKELGLVRAQTANLNMLSLMWIRQKEYDKGLDYAFQALELNKRIGRKRGTSISLLYIANGYHEAEKFGKAVKYAKESLEMAEGLNALSIDMDNNEILSSSYAGLNQHEEALKHYRTFVELSDSFNRERTNGQLMELQTKFETEQKDLKIESLELKRKIQEGDIEKRNIAVIGLVLLLFLVFVLVFLFWQRRKIKNERKAIELEQKALRARMNPHFLFNALNSIQRMFLKDDHEKANDYLTDFAHLIRNTLENTGKSTIPLQKEVESLRLYLSLEQTRLENKLDYEINLESEDMAHLQIPTMLIQPFVENSIWHGISPKKTDGKIIINFYKVKERKFLKCEIIDDGIGIEASRKEKSETQNHVSQGLNLIEKRLGSKNAITMEEIRSKNEVIGTKVTVLINLDR